MHAPLAGTVLALADVPDPVFAQHLLGPGVALDPDRSAATITVRSPVTGRVGALHPHAFAIEAEGGEVLVHLGIDTVTLQGGPFDLLLAQGDHVQVGAPVVRWRIGGIGGLSPLVPVIALGGVRIEQTIAVGAVVEPGHELFAVREVT